MVLLTSASATPVARALKSSSSLPKSIWYFLSFQYPIAVKSISTSLVNLTAIGYWKDKKYQMLFGRDEELLSALATGVADADVSSTINFMTLNLPLKLLFDQY